MIEPISAGSEKTSPARELLRVGRAIVWGQVGRVAEAVLFFAFSLFLARVLGPYSYGIYALGVSVAALFGFLTLLGIGPETLGKFVPEVAAGRGRGRPLALLRKILALRAVTIGIVLVVGFSFGDWILREFHLPWLGGLVGLVLLLFAVRSLYDLFTYFSSGMLKLGRVARAKVLTAAATISLFLLFFVAGRNSTGSALLATGGGYAFGVLLLAVPLLRPDSSAAERETNQPIPLRRILEFGVFAWVTNFFLFVLSDSADVLLLSWLVKDTAAVGYYAVGSRLVFRVTSLLLGWMTLVSIPAFSHAYLQGGYPGLAASARAQWKLVVVSLIGPFLLMIRFARQIITLFYSPAYSLSVPVIQILCCLLVGGAIFGFSVQAGVLYILNRERLACSLVAAAALLNWISEIFLVRTLGIDGAAWATGLSFVFLSILCATATCRLVPLRFPLYFTLKVSAAGLLAVVSTLWLEPDTLASLCAAAALYCGVFIICLALFKPLNSIDSEILRSVSRPLASVAQRWFVRAELAPETDPIP